MLEKNKHKRSEPLRKRDKFNLFCGCVTGVVAMMPGKKEIQYQLENFICK